MTVSTEWTGPDGVTFTSSNPVAAVVVNLTQYTSLAMIGAARNGSYTCLANVSSSSQFITGSGILFETATITVGMSCIFCFVQSIIYVRCMSCSPIAPLPHLINLMATVLPTFITLTWEQPQESEAGAVEDYEINYSFTVNECRGDERIFQTVTVLLNGSLRSYKIMNSPTTPVEEDSTFSISITAINSVGRSEPSNTIIVITPEAGEPRYLLVLTMA